jgi:hypothetical protein
MGMASVDYVENGDCYRCNKRCDPYYIKMYSETGWPNNNTSYQTIALCVSCRRELNEWIERKKNEI